MNEAPTETPTEKPATMYLVFRNDDSIESFVIGPFHSYDSTVEFLEQTLSMEMANSCFLDGDLFAAHLMSVEEGLAQFQKAKLVLQETAGGVQ